MKKVKLTLVILVILALAVFTLTACGNDKENGGDTPVCEHDYSYVTIKEPTCTEKGVESGVCSLCGDDTTRHIDSLGHDEVSHEAKAATCTENGYDAYVACSRCGYTTYNEIAALGHAFEKGNCSRCGEETQLYMKLSYDESCYIVSGVGEFDGNELEIPANYKNKPVKEIGANAFKDCADLASVVIPDSVTSIGDFAFWGCTSLTSVTIGNGVTSISKFAFQNCTSLTSIVIPDSVTSIGRYAFSGCTSLTSIEIPDSVTSIGGYAFDGCTSITIYCEEGSKPSGWDSNWNYSNCPVVWGYTGE